MKNIQVIDDAINTGYEIYSVTDEEFNILFPGSDQDVEFIEDVVDRIGDDEVSSMMKRVWKRPVSKSAVRGIHGTLFYGLEEKKKFYEDKREPVINWRLVE